ncbi:MFRP-like protein [Mya arenaria]|uniref:MFRP-like protein n=1 Tax=Mya arenaria TaxID=6604 RepID=A0ABY7EEA2_MYAAR|nr:MFRP-like protein [Mya arenaria]
MLTITYKTNTTTPTTTNTTPITSNAMSTTTDHSFTPKRTTNTSLTSTTSISTTRMPTTTTSPTPCGGTLIGTEGTIISPKHFQENSSNVICTWHLSVPEGYILRLKIMSMNLTLSENCDTESVTIYESSQSVLERFCGGDIQALTVFSDSNDVTIEYSTTDFNRNRGFFIRYWKQES